MKKKLTLSLVATVACLASPLVHAEQSISTAEMLQYCTAKDGSFVTCEIYGQAVYDTYLVLSADGQAAKTICVKQPAPSRTDVIKSYVTWAQSDAKYANEPAAQTMLQFLATTFPCPKAN